MDEKPYKRTNFVPVINNKKTLEIKRKEKMTEIECFPKEVLDDAVDIAKKRGSARKKFLSWITLSMVISTTLGGYYSTLWV